jgi:hypothetical protein
MTDPGDAVPSLRASLAEYVELNALKLKHRSRPDLDT